MSGISKKTPLPLWGKIMKKAGCTTATELAKKADISIQTAHSYVYGLRTATKAEAIFKIAKAARIDPTVLLADITRYSR